MKGSSAVGQQLIVLTEEQLSAVVRRAVREELSSQSSSDDSDWMTLVQAAKFLNVCTKTLAAKAKSGKVPHKKLGDVYRFSRRELEKALKAG